MARLIDITAKREEMVTMVRRVVQSSHLNWLLGSGCSSPALLPLGNLESDIRRLRTAGKENEAQRALFSFAKPFLEDTVGLTGTPNANAQQTLAAYKRFLACIIDILFERKGSILERQVNLFTTNYDLYLERAFEEMSTLARFNDGFIRIPRLAGSYTFSPSEFFNAVHNSGNVFNYIVRVPSLNVIKLHGSVNWQNSGEQIVFRPNGYDTLLQEWDVIAREDSVPKMKAYCENLPIVLPELSKFEHTVLNRTYYDLFRIFANQLDRENVLLVAQGCSFSDAHIYDLTNRALKNPTLIVLIMCFSAKELPQLQNLFSQHRNVYIVHSAISDLSFDNTNSVWADLLPPKGSEPGSGVPDAS